MVAGIRIPRTSKPKVQMAQRQETHANGKSYFSRFLANEVRVADCICGSKVDMDVCLDLCNIRKMLGSIRGEINRGGASSVPFFNVLFFLVLALLDGFSCILLTT